MKRILLIAFFLSIYIDKAQILKGSIRSKQTKESLPGAVIYFPDLKSGTNSRTDGSFELKNLPKIKTIVQIKLIGYKTYVQQIDLATATELEIELEESVIEANEVVVTGVSRATEIKRNPVPMVFIDNHYLNENTSTNIIDAIAKVPGVNALQTGPNVSKPFIRGLGYNRILTLFDGVRQESQQWGDEHGIEVDQYVIDRIEVVKGPASLIYGSDALAGVVNLIPANPSPEGEISGALQGNYQTNNGSRGGSFHLSGNSSGFIWGIRSSYKEATDYTNKYDGRVYNTGFREKDLNTFIGLNRKWGYSHLNFGLYDNEQEIPDGSRDSSSRKFTKQITEEDTLRPIVKDSELNSYTIHGVHQRVQHYRIFSANNFILGQSKLAVKVGAQKSLRQEFSHPLALNVPGLSLNMNTITYDAKFFFPEKRSLESIIGLNGMYQANNANAGTEFVIPSFTIFDIAPFFYLKKNFDKFDLAAGARYDTRMFNNSAMYINTDTTTGFVHRVDDSTGAFKQFDPYAHTFNGFSGSFGVTYNISKKIMIKFNVARGYRAPNISEISAKGVHPGTGFQQLGDANLKPEFSLQEDIGFFYENEHVSASAEVFNNTISNYIFNQKLRSFAGGDSIYMETGNSYPVYKFIQTKAQLIGGEARLDIHPHPLDWLHFSNAVSFVYATNLGGNGAAINDSNKYLPFIPPLHTSSELSAEFLKSFGPLEHIFIKVGLQYYAAQNRAFLFNNTETKTASYTLLDAGMGAEVKNKKDRTLFTIGVYVTNITNAAYQSNMSRLKYFDNYPVNGTGRSGIYNMGRNWSVKLNIPFNVKKTA
jgi:iron complex outermembrane receptor protein